MNVDTILEMPYRGCDNECRHRLGNALQGFGVCLMFVFSWLFNPVYEKGLKRGCRYLKQFFGYVDNVLVLSAHVAYKCYKFPLQRRMKGWGIAQHERGAVNGITWAEEEGGRSVPLSHHGMYMKTDGYGLTWLYCEAVWLKDRKGQGG